MSTHATDQPESIAQNAAELHHRYPWAVVEQKHQGKAKVAANVRGELRAAYPKARFRVRRSGDGVVVSWQAGPPAREIAERLAKYHERQSDDSSTPMDRAMDEVFGPLTFVDLEREGGAE